MVQAGIGLWKQPFYVSLGGGASSAPIKMANMENDPYTPGFIPLKSTELKCQSFPKKLLRRPDDHNTVTNTESVTVTAVDSGGNRGIYTFYFDVDVFDTAIPL